MRLRQREGRDEGNGTQKRETGVGSAHAWTLAPAGASAIHRPTMDNVCDDHDTVRGWVEHVAERDHYQV